MTEPKQPMAQPAPRATDEAERDGEFSSWARRNATTASELDLMNRAIRSAWNAAWKFRAPRTMAAQPAAADEETRTLTAKELRAYGDKCYQIGRADAAPVAQADAQFVSQLDAVRNFEATRILRRILKARGDAARAAAPQAQLIYQVRATKHAWYDMDVDTFTASDLGEKRVVYLAAPERADAARTPLDQPEAVGYVTPLTAKHRHGIMTPEPRDANDVPLYTASPDRVRREALPHEAEVWACVRCHHTAAQHGDHGCVVAGCLCLATKGQS